MDVHLTKDGEVVVFHDFETTRLLPSLENQKIENLTLAEIQSHTFPEYNNVSLDANYLSDTERTAPSLRCVLEMAKKHGVLVFLETKDVSLSRCVCVAREMVKVIEELDMFDSVVVISFIPSTLYFVRREDPRVLTCLLLTKTLSSSLVEFPSVTNTITYILLYLFPSLFTSFLGISMIGPTHHLLSITSIQAWQARGIDVYTWTVNEKAKQKFFDAQNVSIGTDNCTLMKRLRGKASS